MIGSPFEELEENHLRWRMEYAACSLIPISKRFQLLVFNFLIYKLQRFMIPYALFFRFSVLISEFFSGKKTGMFLLIHSSHRLTHCRVPSYARQDESEVNSSLKKKEKKKENSYCLTFCH